MWRATLTKLAVTVCAILPSVTAQYGLPGPNDTLFSYLGYFPDNGTERTLSSGNSALKVTTSTGSFIGNLNDTYPSVRQFLRVPYAKPPVGKLRWLPPQKLDNSTDTIDSTFIGPSCPQFIGSARNAYNLVSPPNPIINLNETRDQGQIAWDSSEDCLTVAIWTPANITADAKLPVAVFVTGGGGVLGGINIPAQLPSQWISRTQSHIVVTMNYRVSIFGNPKSRALDDNNLTLMDVRAALEWTSEHIQAFGGDPKNILLWGQSQGAALTHLYTLAYPDEPLARKFGVISSPPSVNVNLSAADPYADFDTVALGLGCNYGNDSTAALECLRGKSWVAILQFINSYQPTPAFSYGRYIPDEKLIFANESARYAAGKVAKGPAIRSDAARESPSVTANDTVAGAATRAWNCVALADSTLRASLNLSTYRYLFAGNWSNISPVPALGAWHFTDLEMIFGTYNKTVGPISELEVQTSATMQDYFLQFIKDENSMETFGWPAFQPNAVDGPKVLEFGKDVPVQIINASYIDASCSNASIPFPSSG